MKSFKSFLTEKTTGRGVQFEWALVHQSLLLAKVSQSEIKKRNAQSGGSLTNYDKDLGALAQRALKNVPRNLLKLAQHSDELGISGNPEPKTDILFGSNVRVSVKLDGAVQLSSGEGRSTAKLFEETAKSVVGLEKDKILSNIIKRIREMPTKLLDPNNIEKAVKENPNKAKDMIKGGKVLNEYNWQRWKIENRDAIKKDISSFLKTNPDFNFVLVEEALTGKRVFSNNIAAAATHILSPSKFAKIDKKFVTQMVSASKLDIRAKSRKGITSVAVRFDVKDIQISEDVFLDESFLSSFKQIAKNVLNVLSKWFTAFKQKVESFFKNNIDEIVDEEIEDLSFNLELRI